MVLPMLVLALVLCPVTVLATQGYPYVVPPPPPAPYGNECIVGQRNAYNKSAASQVPWYTVDLDADPYHRWDEVAAAYKPQITAMIDFIKNGTIPLAGMNFINWVDSTMGPWDNLMPEPFQSELRGIADVTGLPLGEIMLYNMFYEISTACTSIIAHDPQGKMYHARNLDFGLFIGWNRTTHGWDLHPYLSNLAINVRFIENGVTNFKMITFAGYIGAYNGIKQNAFTFTMNERFDIGSGGLQGIYEWVMGLTPNVNLCTYEARDVMQYSNTYEQAQAALMTKPLMAPAYFILGGTNPQQAVLISRGRFETVEYSMIGDLYNEDFFVLQTNYDQANAPLYIDDRRTPGVECMNKLGIQNVSFEGLFNVLSSKNNLNKETIMTVLMQVDSGDVETILQDCPQPCYFV